jgi:hypothetical protein
MKVAVFTHKDGSQFLVPGYWEDLSEDRKLLPIVDAMMFAIVTNTKVKWVDIPVNANGLADLPHQKAMLAGPQFAHGGHTVLRLISPIEEAAP